MARDYQLVLEFEGDDLAAFDSVIHHEDVLSRALKSGEVDGHDAGQGIINIFIYTDYPEHCFSEILRIIDGVNPAPSAVGYRPVKAESYVRLWPKNDSTAFSLR